jgi:hypothetical protein
MSNIKFNQNDFDNDFLNMMSGYAKALNVPLAEMMERMLIRRFAEDRALIDVYGTGGPEIVLEFMEFEGMEPKELFKMLYFMKREELEKQYVESLKATPWEACSESEKELLTRYGIGPVAEQKKAAEKQNIDELRKKYNLPKRKPGQNSHWEE